MSWNERERTIERRFSGNTMANRMLPKELGQMWLNAFN